MSGINRAGFTATCPRFSIWHMVGITALLIACGCGRSLTADEYVAYIDRQCERYSEEVKRNGFAARVTYLPREYLAARDMALGSLASREAALKRYDQALHLRVSLRPEGGIDQLATKAWGRQTSAAQQWSGDRTDDFFVVVRDDTVHMASLRYDSPSGMVPEAVYMLCFPAERILPHKANARLVLRNTFAELGTVDVNLGRIMRPAPALRG